MIYDAGGQRLVSSHTSKNGKRYRYYVTPEGDGRLPSDSTGKKMRLPAAEIDELVLTNLQAFLKDKRKISTLDRSQGHRASDIRDALDMADRVAHQLASNDPAERQTAINDLVSRVDVTKDALQVRIRSARLMAGATHSSQTATRNHDEACVTIDVPFSRDRARSHRLLIEARDGHQPDLVVVKAIARAWQWFEDLSTGRATSMADIAKREGITDNYVSNLIHLAWLPSKMVESILDGHPQATAVARNLMLRRDIEPIWENVPGNRVGT